MTRRTRRKQSISLVAWQLAEWAVTDRFDLLRWIPITEQSMASTLAQLLEDMLQGLSSGMEGFLSRAERSSFIALVELLAKQDSIAVRDAVNHLVEEKRKIAIPPLFLAGQKHSSETARRACLDGVRRLDTENEVPKLVENVQDLQAAVNALIEHFGNYRLDTHE